MAEYIIPSETFGTDISCLIFAHLAYTLHSDTKYFGGHIWDLGEIVNYISPTPNFRTNFHHVFEHRTTITRVMENLVMDKVTKNWTYVWVIMAPFEDKDIWCKSHN
ncbi:hypothetical protein GQR58_026211 [Nymphon striatum]|nr:hypothetical protein GQR58_026211 [Nymphon striatum]